MCEPATILAGVGAAFSVLGALQQGKEAQQQAYQQSSANLRAAQTEEVLVEDAVQRGSIEAGRFRDKVNRVASNQRAHFAGANIDISSATAQAFLSETAVYGELDALIIENNAQREAWSHAQRAEELRHGAAGSQAVGSAARTSSLLSAGGQLAYSTSNLLLR